MGGCNKYFILYASFNERPSPTMNLSIEEIPVSYVVTIAPGTVRYLSVKDFLMTDIEPALDCLRSSSIDLEIKPPLSCIYGISFGEAFSATSPKELEKLHSTRLDLAEYDNLFKNESWEQRLRTHHKLGRLFLTEAMPTSVYCCFYEFFQLKEHAIEKCLESWVKQCWSADLVDSYRKSKEHIVVRHFVRDREFEFVFTKTSFVKERLEALAQDEAEKKSALDLELLRRSRFDCYVYLMEDLRNKSFKIGKSKTPGKRERTLQSEVPQIVIRFSIPAEETHEKELHEHFNEKRIRGEWFALSEADLVWIVSFLKSKGDTSRAFVDFEWIGRVHFNC